jgi:hypothetical protein
VAKRILVQSPHLKDGAIVRVDDGASFEQLKAACLAALPPGHASAALEIFDEADDDEEARGDADTAPPEPRESVHVGHCRKVVTVVRYAGRSVEHLFSPATRVGRVKNWAVRRLGISHHDANELVLQIAGTSIQPARDKHIGCFVGQTCEVRFDLVRSYTINGDPTSDVAEQRLRQDLEAAPFIAGERDGRWVLRELAWPLLFVDVVARDKRRFTLRLQCRDYPQAPTGAFWDPERGSWLAAANWPRAGARFGNALRTDWQGGTALYIPCDRLSINGHDQWRQLHPAWLWDPQIGIVRYLDVVWTLINGSDYVATAA